MSERHRQLGLLQELREQLAQLEDRCENCKASLLECTFAVKSFFDLDAGRIRGAAGDLTNAITQGQELRNRIAKLEEDLGL